jgi:hypothetical protein
MSIRKIILLCWFGLALALPGIREAQAEGAPAAAPKALLLLKTSSASGTSASFGRSAVDGAMSRALKEPFEKLGIVFASASGATPSVGEASAGLPLSDAAATDMARQAGATIAVIAGIRVQPQGAIRATAFLSQKASLRLRVLDVAGGEVVYETRLSAFGYHKSEDQGGNLAMAKAITQANEGLVPELRARWASSSPAKGTSLILTVSGADSWRPLSAILQKLAVTKGVESVHVIGIDSSRVRLAVSSRQSITSLIANLRRTRIYNGSISVTASGNAISVSLQMRAPIPVSHG